jgi:hypothetical protein
METTVDKGITAEQLEEFFAGLKLYPRDIDSLKRSVLVALEADRLSLPPAAMAISALNRYKAEKE